MKRCRKCLLSKSAEEFSKNSRSSDGLGSWCKECARAYAKERLQDPEVRESVRLRSLEYQRAKRGDTRVCVECHEIKLRTEFPVRPRNLDGRGPWCFSCAEKWDAKQQQATEKTCPKCKQTKPMDEFGSLKNTWCLQCCRQYAKTRRSNPEVKKAAKSRRKQYRQENLSAFRAEGIQRYRETYAFVCSLKDAPCMDCGKVLPTCCMDFDHVRGAKVAGVGRMFGYSKDKILEEVAKCDVVCACCHRTRTKNQRQRTKNPTRLLFLERIEGLKENVPCKDCGCLFPPEAVDFDHVLGSKVKNVSAMRLNSQWDAVLEEISKCEIVCANCHRVRTRHQKNSGKMLSEVI